MRIRTKRGKDGQGSTGNSKANPGLFPVPGRSASPSAVSSIPDSSAQGGAVLTSGAAAPTLKLKDASKLTAAEIDRMAVVNAVLADYKVQVAPWEKEKTFLENRVAAATENLAADAIYVDESEKNRLLVGEQAEQQQLEAGALAKVFDLIGKDRFLGICAVTFKDLERALSPEQYAEIVKKHRTGKRTIKIVPKAAPEPLKAA